jgi:hypothetical protein
MTLEEIREKIETLAKMDDLTEDQVKELEKLNKQATKMVAQEQAGKVAEAAKAQIEEQRKAETQKQIAEALKAEREKWEAEKGRLVTGDVPYATKYHGERKFDNLTTADLSVMLEVAHAFKNAGQKFDVSPEAYKALSRRVAAYKSDNSEEGLMDEEYVKGAFKAYTATHIEPNTESVEQAIKAATDPMYSGGSGIGSDWVGTAYSTELWKVIRGNREIMQLLPSEIIPDGYSSKTWPLESTDFTVYKVAEASASDATLKVPAATITASQVATANKNIGIAKIGARGLYTEELNEDSLVRAAPQLREQISLAMMERLESAIVDGDTELSANKNINDIAGTPASTDYFLVWDGFRKLALVTNTANSRSASGGLVVEDYKNTLKLLGTAGLGGSDPNKVRFIQDFNVMWAAMEIPELKTKDVHSAATIEDGFLKRVYRVPVIDSYFMHMQSTAAGYERKANTAGKIDVDTTTNNTTGAILAVRFDQWKFVYKRKLTIETTRIANADSWEIVALARAGLGYRDTEASAITYNVGV